MPQEQQPTGDTGVGRPKRSDCSHRPCLFAFTRHVFDLVKRGRSQHDQRQRGRQEGLSKPDAKIEQSIVEQDCSRRRGR